MFYSVSNILTRWTRIDADNKWDGRMLAAKFEACFQDGFKMWSLIYFQTVLDVI